MAVNLSKTFKDDFQLNKNIEYNAHPIDAPNIHKSPFVNFKDINDKYSPLMIIVKTPNKQETNPINLNKFIFSLKKK